MSNDELARERKRPLDIWDWPKSLLVPPHEFRRRKPKKPKERKHMGAILGWAYKSRLCTGEQIRRRYPDILKSARTARRHLSEMQELGYLDTVQTPSPLWPKIFSVTGRGVRRLAEALKKKGRLWESPVYDRGRIGIQNVIHEVFCTEFLLRIFEDAKSSSGIELLTIERRSLPNHDAFLLPGKGRLIPDGMFMLKAGRGMICSFLEIDTGTMSMSAMAEKFHRYSRWADSERGQDFLLELYRKQGAGDPQARFRIAIVCGGSIRVDDDRRARAVMRVLNDGPAVVRSSAWLTPTNAIRDADNVLTAAFWKRCGSKDQRGFLSKL